jgi:subfamily B ATP-binding cassette protein MsbA
MNALRELNQTRAPAGRNLPPRVNEDIHFRDVSFAYGETPILKNVNLRIPAHSMVALVGESGAGKSTMADLLCATLAPTRGEIFLGTDKLNDLDLSAYRSRIGYVTQEGVLFDDTVANNISLWSHAPGQVGEQKIWDALTRANCADFVRSLPNGLQEQIGDRGVKLSGGQRQRLCLAREFYKSTDLLILDEATSALDNDSEQLVQDSIDSLKGKATIILIAHRLSTVRHCDYVCVMKKGEVVEFGTYAELIGTDSLFRRMHLLSPG